MSEPRRRERTLLVDDDDLSRDFLAAALTAQGLDVRCSGDGDDACARLRRESFDLVFTDLRMPGRDGLAVLAAAKEREPDRPVVLVTAHGTLGTAIDALRAGADDILEKPVGLDELQLCIERVRAKGRLMRENRYLREAQTDGEHLVIAGPGMRRVADLVAKVAASPATVLVCGESGTGKERVAAMVHQQSPRRDGPFVKVNCAAVPDALMESEFFGHEAGAFTGAQRRRIGRFELADRGTLFLDEIGEMALPLQAKLLRVLQEGRLCRMGANEEIAVDVRVVCATNRDLRREVAEGRFREDLLYRLDVVRVEVPPLRQRKDEIEPLARAFLAGRVQLSDAALSALRAWSWPGNVRELHNVLQRAELLCEAGTIDVGDLALGGERAVVLPAPERGESVDPIAALVGRPLREVEGELIEATLRRHGGNRTRTARVLGIGVRTLFNKLALS